MKLIISNITSNTAKKLIGCLLSITDTGIETLQIKKEPVIKKIVKKVKK